MKHLKKELSFLLALALVITSLSVGIGVIKAKAAGPFTITLNGNDGRTYDPIIVNEGGALTALPLAKFGNTEPWILPKPYVEGKSFGLFQGWFLDNITYQQPVGRDYIPTSDMVLYGKWHYNIITFDSNGGSAVTAVTTPWNTQVSQPADPVKAGSTFVGWFLEDTFQNIVTWPYTLMEDTRVYAQWDTAGDSVMSFESNGGPAVSPIVAATNSSVSEPAAPTWTNHTFGGWYSDAGLTTPVSWPYTLSADVTFYAKWTGVASTVTFDAQGGSVSPSSSVVNYGDTYAEGTGGLPTPTLSGYFFRGWYTEAGGAGTQIIGTTVVTITGPQTLYAKWTEHASDVYFVQFDGNGNTGGSTASCVCTINVTSDLTPNGFFRTGYRWLGWSTNPAASTPEYSGDSISVYNMTTTPNQVITLYAVWEIRSYDIWFDARGGTGSTSYLNVEYGSPLTAPTVTKTGYTFSGWSPEVPATVPATHETYFAVWTANTYTIVYDGNGADGGSTPNATRTYNDWARPLGPNGYTKTGYVFNGWATSPSGSVVYTYDDIVNNLTADPDGVVTLYAVWEPGVFNVRFEANGGTGGTSGPMTYGDPLTPPTVTRTGYTFDSWLPSVPATVAAGNAMYVAQWTPNEYTVIYDGNGSDGGSTASTVHTYDGYKVLAYNGYTKTGYNFVAWNTAADGSGTSYVAAQSVLNLAASGSVTLYAQWSINTHYVIFCPNGADGDPIMQGITYGQSANLQSNTYTRTGYTFAGWNTQPDGSGTAWADGAYYGPVNSPNEWLYAQWTAHTYTVTYDGNTHESGSTADSYHTYGTASNLTPNGFIKEGYAFDGWNTAADGSGTAYADNQSVTDVTPVNGATVTFYAQWTMIPADISEVETLTAPALYIEMTGSDPVLEGDGTQAGTVYWYGTPAQREDYNEAYTDAMSLLAESPMPDTAYNRGRIAAAAQALGDAMAVLEANPNPADYTYCDAEVAAAGTLNLNRYTLASLDSLQTAADSVTAGKLANGQSDVNGYTTGLYNSRTNLVPYSDTRSPWLNVLETDASMSGITIPGYDPADFGNVTYVYPGKAWYTYYCYTNSENPSIVVSIADLADTNGRISYPAAMDITSVSGTVNAGWMNYTYDSGQRAGTVSQGSVTVAGDRYADYTIGMDYDPLGADYYRQQGYLVLKPEFVQAGGRQFAKYTINGKDDAAADGNVADTTSLAGGNTIYQAGVAMTTGNQSVTPLNTITIYVEYRNAMSLDGGTWYDDGRSASSLHGYNTLLADDQWVNHDYIYRTSGGAANDEIIGTGDAVYTANDPDYGKEGLACFYYWLNDTADADVISEFNANGQYSATRMMMADIDANPTGYTLHNWPKAATSISGFDPNTNSRLVYVHMVDRWGNVFNRIIKTNNVDAITPTSSQEGLLGYVKITEDGGSAVYNIRLYQYAFEGTPSFVIPYWSDQLIEDLGVINSEDNTFNIHVDPAQIDDPSGRLTLYVRDKAGNEYTKTLSPDANGDILFEIVDPMNMPGGGAVNSVGSAYSFLFDDTVTVNLNMPGVPKLTAISTTVIDEESGFIYGLNAGITQMNFESDYGRVVGNGRLTFTPAANFGTGTKVNLVDNATGQVLKTYTIVIFGDVNGDGNIDTADAAVIVDLENFVIAWDSTADAALYKAADLNGDGNVDTSDAGCIVDYENFILDISQSAGIASAL